MKKLLLKYQLGYQGMGLLEVIVAGGIAIVVILGMTAGIMNAFRAMKSISLSQESTGQVQGISLVLQSKKQCATALGGVTFPTGWTSVSVNSITLGTSVIAQTGLAQRGVMTQSIIIEPLNGPFPIKVNTAIAGPPVLVDMNRYSAKMTLKQNKVSTGVTANTGGDQIQDKIFFMSLVVDPATGALNSCFGGQDISFFQNTCEVEMGGTYDESKGPSCLLSQIYAAPDFTTRDAVKFNATSSSQAQGAVIAKTILPNYGDWGNWGAGTNFRTWWGICPVGALCNLGGAIGTDYFHISGSSNNAFVPASTVVGESKRVLGLFDHVIIPFPNATLGIGMVGAVPSEALEVMRNGRFHGNLIVDNTITATTVTTTSDKRLKNIQGPFEDALDRLASLSVVRFLWKKDKKNKAQNIGLIAQEVEKQFPEAVARDSFGTLSIKHDQLISVLVKSVQELKVQNEELRKRLEKLENPSK